MRYFQDHSDEECIQVFLSKKDKDAFGEIFNRYFDDTYRFVYSRVGNKLWTEEITSDTFYTLIEALKTFNKEAHIKTFIFGIALNKIRQFWQKKYARHEVKLFEDVILTDDLEEAEKDNEHLSKILSEVLGKLPEKYRMVLEERFINEKSIKETAVTLKLSEANVRVIQSRALKKATEIGEKLLNEN